MHVSVDADARLAIAHRHDQVGRLSSHAVEREKVVDRVGHPSGETVEHVVTDPEDDACLRSIEADGIYEALDATGGELQHALRGGGLGEEAVGRGARRRVLGSKRQDAGDQDSERVALAGRDDGERGRVPRRRRPAKPADHGVDRHASSVIASKRLRARACSHAADSTARARARQS